MADEEQSIAEILAEIAKDPDTWRGVEQEISLLFWLVLEADMPIDVACRIQWQHVDTEINEIAFEGDTWRASPELMDRLVWWAEESAQGLWIGLGQVKKGGTGDIGVSFAGVDMEQLVFILPTGKPMLPNVLRALGRLNESKD